MLAWALLAVGTGLVFQGRVMAQSSIKVTSPEYLLSVIQRDDGLPHNTVSTIAQTLDGYLWVGTHDGLARFDGAKFTFYPSKQTPGLTSDHIDCLSADANGALWIGLERGGVSRWHKGKFETLSPLAGYTNRINTIASDGEVGAWSGLSQGRLSHLSDGEWTTLSPGTNFPTQGRVFCTVDSDHRLWFASESSYGYFDSGRCVPLATNQLSYFRIATRPNGGIWLAHDQRLDRLDSDLGSTTVANLLPLGNSGGIEVLYEDRRGTLWLGTRGNGLYRFEDGKLSRVPTSHDYILAICEDSEGDIWVGTWGGGLNRLKRR
jgi:ligand-binding sensor domain-containing protein